MTGPCAWLAHRRTATALERHFQGRLSATGERRMRRHLLACAGCRALYASLALAEGEGEAARRARRARLEAALFGGEEQEPRASRRLALGVLGAAAAAALAVVLVARDPGAPEWREKGSALGDPASRFVSMTVYVRSAGADGGRHGGDGGFLRVAGEVASGQPLAFAYSNQAPEGFDRLLLFAVDDLGIVYWYYPAWRDPQAPPAGAYPIRPGASDVELPDQVAHRYEGRVLRIFALFTTRRDLGVQEVEAAARELARPGHPIEALDRFPLAGTGQHSLLLRVRRP